LAAIEIARLILELATAIRDMPSAIQRKLEPVQRIWRFWADYGVRCTVLGLITGGSVAVRGQPGVANGTVRPAAGRVVWGVSPDAFSKFDADDITFLVAFLDNFGHPNDGGNALDQHIKDLRTLIVFLYKGWRSGAIMPSKEDAEKCCGKHSQNEYRCARLEPEREGSTKLSTASYSLEEVLDRVRDRVMKAETKRIQAACSQ
jgi:hypothetical protein